MSHTITTIGIDGCRAGWLAVSFDGQAAALLLHTELHTVHPVQQIWIDMPIGLVSDGTIGRSCDQLARQYLSPLRHSSVFTPPCRAAAYSPTAVASAVNFSHTGKKLSQQSLNILPKIKELDVFLQNQPTSIQTAWQEAHPEVVFAALNGAQALETSKKTIAGQTQRLALLAHYFSDLPAWWPRVLKQYPRKEVQADDILDALALAIAAYLCQTRQTVLTKLPARPPHDDTGLAMQIVFAQLK